MITLLNSTTEHIKRSTSTKMLIIKVVRSKKKVAGRVELLRSVFSAGECQEKFLWNEFIHPRNQLYANVVTFVLQNVRVYCVGDNTCT